MAKIYVGSIVRRMNSSGTWQVLQIQSGRALVGPLDDASCRHELWVSLDDCVLAIERG